MVVQRIVLPSLRFLTIVVVVVYICGGKGRGVPTSALVRFFVALEGGVGVAAD